MPPYFPSPAAPMWVLLIEDEARLADSVRRGLEEEGYRVDVAGDAEAGERLALENAYDAFVVDWRLPRGDGKTLVERIRAAGKDQPVLMLTALSDVEHRVAGLDAGADDYLPKPFAFEELVARLRALLRRPPLSDQERTVSVGPLTLDGERRKVTMSGPGGEAVLNLRPKEYAMLEVFMRSADAVLSRTVLAERGVGRRALRDRQRARCDGQRAPPAARGRREDVGGRARTWDRDDPRRGLPARTGRASVSASRSSSMARLSTLPISARLALWYALTLLLLLSAFAVFCYVGFHAAAHRSFDRHLDHEMGVVAPLVRVGPGGADAGALERTPAAVPAWTGRDGTYVRVLSPTGAVLYQSPNVAGHPPLGVTLPEGRDPLRLSREWDGEPARSLVQPVVSNGGLAGYVEVTGFEWSRHAELEELGRMLVLGVALSVLFALGAGWWLARRSLRPVAVLTEAAGQMAADGARLGGRLPSEFETRDELTDLAETFNGLLGRLEASVERERRFTSNAAHELLTPLATLPERGRGRAPARARARGIPRDAGAGGGGRGRDDGDRPGPPPPRPRRVAREDARGPARPQRARGPTDRAVPRGGPRRRTSTSRSTSSPASGWRPRPRRWRRSSTTWSGTPSSTRRRAGASKSG